VRVHALVEQEEPGSPATLLLISSDAPHDRDEQGVAEDG